MKKSLILASILFSCLISNAQGVICRVHNNTSTFESRLDTAIAHCQNGDVLYLPGGLVASATSIYITKKLTIIGAGYHPDSSKATSPSVFLSNIYFNPGSDSSLLTGLDCRGEVNFYTSNITVTRCKISNSCNWTNSYAISNIKLYENIFGGAVNASQIYFSSNTLISNNIFFSHVGSFVGGTTFKNNIFAGTTSMQAGNTCLYENNIILSSQGGYSQNLFNNNLFVIPNPGLNGSGNIFNQSLSTIFINYTTSSIWDKTQNFHLKVGCPGISGGTDGTDLGIYGGLIFNFKDGGMPFNPHYQSITIGSQTNSSGKLPINIKVKAQTN